jgi:hypothetical protein
MARLALAGVRGAADAAVVDEEDEEEETEPPLRFCCFSASFAARAIITCSFFFRSSICFFCNQTKGQPGSVISACSGTAHRRPTPHLDVLLQIGGERVARLLLRCGLGLRPQGIMQGGDLHPDVIQLLLQLPLLLVLERALCLRGANTTTTVMSISTTEKL